jgi:hypothetical protein
MLGPVDWAIWILSMIFEAAVVVSSLYRGSFRRYFFLNLYMLITVLVSLGTFRVLMHYGLSSSEYRYFYFYSEALQIIVLYFALIGLYLRVFEELRVERYVRLGAALLLAGTACFSYAVVSQSSHRMLTHFVFELCQNLFFVGLVLTYILWGAILKLKETRTLLVQFVLSLGVYFSAYTASFAISNLRPDLYSYLYRLDPIIDCLLPLTWAYAIWRVPEDSRLTPSRLAVVPR